MNQPSSTKNIAGQSGRPWQASNKNFQHASSRNLTTSPYRTIQLALGNQASAERQLAKKREVAIAESLHKPWIRSSEDFTPLPELGRPSGGSSPVIHYFVDQKTGSRWIGKVGQVPLRDKEINEAARRLPNFLGVYVDEILEKLGLSVYQLLGTEVPESALSYQQVTLEAMHPDMLLAMQLNAEDEGRVFELPHSPRMHYLSRYVEEFQPLGKDFVEHYLANAKRCGNAYVKIQTCDGEMLPLRGLGSMLAAADFVYDLDCLGDACGNAGYVIKGDAAAGDRYAQLVKIDAGYAFSYSDLRTDQTHNPRDRQIRIAPNKMRLQFADLAPADQFEFAETAKVILATPYELLESLFSKTEVVTEGLSPKHWRQLLDELIARKGLFLKAFAPETDRSIVKEIEAARARVAKKFQSKEEISSRAAEELLGQEKEEARALAELRVRLAVVDVEQSDSKEVGECKAFQLPSFDTHFVGRAEALSEVARQLSQTHGSVIGQSISGIGGVGKTQLALQYARAAARGERVDGRVLMYDYVVWLNADVFLEGQFQALAELWIGKDVKRENSVQAVYEFLSNKRSLFVFDNAENIQSIDGFLPPAYYTSCLHLLITSRSARWAGIPTVKLKGFTLEEATEYVTYHLGPQSQESISKLVELLEGLPLAMSQAVSYIKAGHCKLEEFEQTFYLNQANLLSHELLIEDSHPQTVGTTLTLALAQAKVQSPLAEQLLGVLAYLSPDSIQIDLLKVVLQSSQEEVQEAIKALESYSLVAIERSGVNVRVHRLVQEVMRHRHKFLSYPQLYWEKVATPLKEMLIWDDVDLEQMRSFSHIVPHIEQIVKLAKGCNLSKEQEIFLIFLLQKGGAHQDAMGNYAITLKFREQMLELTERHYGSDHPLTATVLLDLGFAHFRFGNTTKQKEFQKRALVINERYYGSDNVNVAFSLVALSTAHNTLRETAVEIELLERALAIYQSNYGPDHPEVGRVLVNLADAYGTLGDVQKKKMLLERALTINQLQYGPGGSEVARTLNALSATYAILGDKRRQKELLKRSLIIYQTHYGLQNPRICGTLEKLSNVYGELGKFQKQKQLLERALAIKIDHFGKEHSEVGMTLIKLSALYGTLGDVSKQRELSDQALAINQRHFGEGDIRIAFSLFEKAFSHIKLQQYSEAKPYGRKALLIFKQFYGQEHPVTKQVEGLLRMCEVQIDIVQSKIDLLNKASKAPVGEVALDASMSEELAKDATYMFARAVENWVQELQCFLDADKSIRYENVHASALIAKVLRILQKNQWNQLFEDPAQFGIHRELFVELNKFKESNPILLKADSFPELIEQLHSSLVRQVSKSEHATGGRVREDERKLGSNIFEQGQKTPIVGESDSGLGQVRTQSIPKSVIRLVEIIAGWGEAINVSLRGAQLQVSMGTILSNALFALHQQCWEQLLEGPSRYGIPRPCLKTLNAYKEEHLDSLGEDVDSFWISEICKCLKEESGEVSVDRLMALLSKRTSVDNRGFEFGRDRKVSETVSSPSKKEERAPDQQRTGEKEADAKKSKPSKIPESGSCVIT